MEKRCSNSDSYRSWSPEKDASSKHRPGEMSEDRLGPWFGECQTLRKVGGESTICQEIATWQCFSAGSSPSKVLSDSRVRGAFNVSEVGVSSLSCVQMVDSEGGGPNLSCVQTKTSEVGGQSGTWQDPLDCQNGPSVGP